MQNSELPPPTSTTSVSCVTGIPSVTPMIVRNASSSCDSTWNGASAVSAASLTMRADIGGAPDRLRAKERDVDCTVGPRGVGIPSQLGGQLVPGRLTQEAAGDDRRA